MTFCRAPFLFSTPPPILPPRKKNTAYQLMIPASQPPGTSLLAFAQTSDGSPADTSSPSTSPLTHPPTHCLSVRDREREREQEGHKKELSSVRKIFKERNRVRGSRKGKLLSPKCFSALSGCLTKAAGEFHRRIRLVAFLWPLTSGGFGLCFKITMK